MRKATLLLAVGLITGPVLADDGFSLESPVYASMQPVESVYAPPAPPREDEGVNEGGVHVDLTIRYVTDYVYRGIDRSEYISLLPDDQGSAPPVDPDPESYDAPNIQIDGKISFDLGKLPHPYLGIFANLFNDDPISRFQEFRPFFGFEWFVKPFIIDIGHQSFILVEREDGNTSEVYGKITLDDRRVFRTERPVLSPYFLAAFDYDLYNAWYLEAGVKHDIILEDWGLTFTFLADAAYVMDYSLYTETGGTDDTGFHHYDIGMIAKYSLNHALNVSKRYGEFSIEGYLMWTDQIERDLRCDPQLWGGAGIAFKY